MKKLLLTAMLAATASFANADIDRIYHFTGQVDDATEDAALLVYEVCREAEYSHDDCLELGALVMNVAESNELKGRVLEAAEAANVI